MIQEYQLRVLPEIAANEQRLKEYLSEEKGLNLRNINATRILKPVSYTHLDVYKRQTLYQRRRVL